MIRKLVRSLKSGSKPFDIAEMQLMYDEIEEKQRKIAEEKARIKEVHANGSRLSSCRFTI
ncbi:hypothetical protein KJE01_22715 [Escherichia marmotae]|uniref:hypothetical protein n=1 Tax=Escherichia TaxID=561 RepID=UPI000943ABFF|nr:MULTISPECIES: hypothetical protein [Escherichia]EFA4129763.1 hypothetical protein [Escherichia coli O13]EFI5570315.1 hypothetical protein [Escherichia coli]EGM8823175.1 hypothetical protein [Escherichia coli]EJO8756759.1 hypothetical protein [Escherichia coli]EJZ0492997.1 hypothetical protein [Escherichia coli]